MKSKEEILFYVKDLTDNSVWAIHKYDTKEGNRLGWLNGTCVVIGDNIKNYIGAECGMDAEYVFTSPKRDFSKQINNLK